MSTPNGDSNATKTKQKASFEFPPEFKDHLEDLVFEILKEKPRDPLEYALNFFSERLKIRDRHEITCATATEHGKDKAEIETRYEDNYHLDNKDAQRTRTPITLTETQAATIIQAYFRGFNVRRNWWKKRYLKMPLNGKYDHLSLRRSFNSPRESFSLNIWPDENVLAMATNYDSTDSEEDVDS